MNKKREEMLLPLNRDYSLIWSLPREVKDEGEPGECSVPVRSIPVITFAFLGQCISAWSYGGNIIFFRVHDLNENNY